MGLLSQHPRQQDHVFLQLYDPTSASQKFTWDSNIYIVPQVAPSLVLTVDVGNGGIAAGLNISVRSKFNGALSQMFLKKPDGRIACLTSQEYVIGVGTGSAVTALQDSPQAMPPPTALKIINNSGGVAYVVQQIINAGETQTAYVPRGKQILVVDAAGGELLPISLVPEDQTLTLQKEIKVTFINVTEGIITLVSSNGRTAGVFPGSSVGIYNIQGISYEAKDEYNTKLMFLDDVLSKAVFKVTLTTPDALYTVSAPITYYFRNKTTGAATNPVTVSSNVNSESSPLPTKIPSEARSPITNPTGIIYSVRDKLNKKLTFVNADTGIASDTVLVGYIQGADFNISGGIVVSVQLINTTSRPLNVKLENYSQVACYLTSGQSQVVSVLLDSVLNATDSNSNKVRPSPYTVSGPETIRFTAGHAINLINRGAEELVISLRNDPSYPTRKLSPNGGTLTIDAPQGAIIVGTNPRGVDINPSPYTVDGPATVEFALLKFGESILLNTPYKQTLANWLPPNKKFYLLYRASRDGATGPIFHTKCNGQGATISIIRSTPGDYLFGGYTSVAWSGNTDATAFTTDATAFLFSLTNPNAISQPKQYFPKNPEKAVLSYMSNGPVFGNHDLIVGVAKDGTNGLGATYQDTTGKGAATFTGATAYTYSDLEVFAVRDL